DGRVLVTGGRSAAGGVLASAEVYDPVTGTWSATGSLAATRFTHTSTLLPSGKVLVVGNPASTEVYDPATGTWTTHGSLAKDWGRTDHTATLLPEGKVLIVGGHSVVGFMASVEVYEDTGAQQAWRPVVLSVSQAARTLDVTGTGFRGVSEAGGGGTAHSPSDVPVLTLQSVAQGTLLRVPFTRFSATAVRASLPPGLSGHYLVSVLPNAVAGGRVALIDTVAPLAPVVTAPVNGSLLTTRTPTFSGTAEAGSTVTLEVDDSSVGTATASASGAWSLTLSTPLSEGTHSARATATDVGGNDSVASSTVSFTVDTLPPAAPVVTAPANGSHVNTATPVLAGTAEAGTTVRVSINGAPAGTVVANAS
ncbi:Kelch repeat-containing protein, partial [Archangium violaceum]